MIEEKNLERAISKLIDNEPLSEAEQQTIYDWAARSEDNVHMYNRIVDSRLCSDTEFFDCNDLTDKVFIRIYENTRRWRTVMVALATVIVATTTLLLLRQPADHDPALYLADRQVLMSTTEGLSIPVDDKDWDASFPFIKNNPEEKTIEIEASYDNRTDEVRQPNIFTLIVPIRKEYNVVLPDGSRVWLNSGSEISFPEFFTGNSREITFKGEGYFEIETDRQIPFIVHNDNLTTTVQGTEYLLTLYDNSDPRVSLIEGELSVTRGEGRFSHRLDSGQGIEFDRKTGTYSRFDVDNNKIEAIRAGLFIFDSEPLEDIVVSLERWYGVMFSFDEEYLAKEKFYIRVDKYEDISILLDMLRQTGKLDYKKQGDLITFTKPT